LPADRPGQRRRLLPVLADEQQGVVRREVGVEQVDERGGRRPEFRPPAEAAERPTKGCFQVAPVAIRTTGLGAKSNVRFYARSRSGVT
jgi:hypothetical protein